jgi:hypothetical protein
VAAGRARPASVGTGIPPSTALAWCAPDMGVDCWGESPLYGNTDRLPLIARDRLTQVLDRSNCGAGRLRGKEATGQS